MNSFKFFSLLLHFYKECPCTRQTCQEVLNLLYNPNVHYYVDKSPPLVPILSKMHPVSTLPPLRSILVHYILFVPMFNYTGKGFGRALKYHIYSKSVYPELSIT